MRWTDSKRGGLRWTRRRTLCAWTTVFAAPTPWRSRKRSKFSRFLSRRDRKRTQICHRGAQAPPGSPVILRKGCPRRRVMAKQRKPPRLAPRRFSTIPRYLFPESREGHGVALLSGAITRQQQGLRAGLPPAAVPWLLRANATIARRVSWPRVAGCAGRRRYRPGSDGRR